LLHQGTQAVAADFIVATQMHGDAERCALLGAHAEAQADALAFGSSDAGLEPFRACPGNRPRARSRWNASTRGTSGGSCAL
jgi:glucose-6-phosphate isomerase